MKATFTILLLAALALPRAALAQAPEPQQDKPKTEAQQKKPAAKPKAAPAAAKPAAEAAPAAQQAAQPAPARKPAAAAPKQAEEPEESVVMIDSKGETEETGRFSAGAFRGDQEEAPAAPGGMPSSYGQLKGVVNEGGRSMLVFESADDGTITFVQVTAGKNGVAWKLVDRIPRSMD